jgi:hypothetical protein
MFWRPCCPFASSGLGKPIFDGQPRHTGEFALMVRDQRQYPVSSQRREQSLTGVRPRGLNESSASRSCPSHPSRALTFSILPFRLSNQGKKREEDLVRMLWLKNGVAKQALSEPPFQLKCKSPVAKGRVDEPTLLKPPLRRLIECTDDQGHSYRYYLIDLSSYSVRIAPSHYQDRFVNQYPRPDTLEPRRSVGAMETHRASLPPRPLLGASLDKFPMMVANILQPRP